MEGAMRRVGATTIPELCLRTGLTGVRLQRDFYKWLKGEHRPLVTTVMPLMRATGMLAAEPATGAGELSNGHPQGSPEMLLHALVQEVRQGFASLGQRVEALETQRPAEARPVPPKRKKAS